jgi:hypothetical protein
VVPKRRPAHARADWPPPGADYPSWPAGAGDPDWVPGADHPSWPAGADGPDWPQPGTDYSGWPAGDPGYGWSPDSGGASRPQLEPAVVRHHEQRRQTPAPVPATRYEYPYPATPPGDGRAGTQRWSARLARTQDTAAQTYHELAFGDGRLQVMLTEPPAADDEWMTGGQGRTVEVLQPGRELPWPAAWEAEDLRNADSVRVTERNLPDAGYQGTEIRREAAARAAAIREAAEQEAAEIRREAAAQAAAIREAAEQEAAELRAHLLAMAAELGRVTAYVTEGLPAPVTPATALALPGASPALPGAEPAPPDTGPVTPGTDTKPARPGTKPGSRPARPDTKPRSRPTAPAKPAGPAAPPAKKPQKRTRQQQAMRLATAGTAALLAIAAIGAVTYTGIHGFSFFVFRESGQGETPGNFTDAKFLARQAAAQHHGSAPKGRHHKTSHGTVEVHHK